MPVRFWRMPRGDQPPPYASDYYLPVPLERFPGGAIVLAQFVQPEDIFQAPNFGWSIGATDFAGAPVGIVKRNMRSQWTVVQPFGWPSALADAGWYRWSSAHVGDDTQGGAILGVDCDEVVARTDYEHEYTCLFLPDGCTVEVGTFAHAAAPGPQTIPLTMGQPQAVIFFGTSLYGEPGYDDGTAWTIGFCDSFMQQWSLCVRSAYASGDETYGGIFDQAMRANHLVANHAISHIGFTQGLGTPESSGPSTTYDQLASCVSFDATGIHLNWSEVASSQDGRALTTGYIALKTNISGAGSFLCGFGVQGDESIGMGFDPDAMIFASNGSTGNYWRVEGPHGPGWDDRLAYATMGVGVVAKVPETTAMEQWGAYGGSWTGPAAAVPVPGSSGAEYDESILIGDGSYEPVARGRVQLRTGGADITWVQNDDTGERMFGWFAIGVSDRTGPQEPWLLTGNGGWDPTGVETVERAVLSATSHWWRWRESSYSGTAQDSIEDEDAQVPLTISNSADLTPSQPGPTADSISVHRTGGSSWRATARIAHMNMTDDFTITCFFKFDSVVNCDLFGIDGGLNDMLTLNSNGSVTLTRGGVVTTSAAGVVTAGVWEQMVYTVNNGRARLYVTSTDSEYETYPADPSGHGENFPWKLPMLIDTTGLLDAKLAAPTNPFNVRDYVQKAAAAGFESLAIQLNPPLSGGVTHAAYRDLVEIALGWCRGLRMHGIVWGAIDSDTLADLNSLADDMWGWMPRVHGAADLDALLDFLPISDKGRRAPKAILTNFDDLDAAAVALLADEDITAAVPEVFEIDGATNINTILGEGVGIGFALHDMCPAVGMHNDHTPEDYAGLSDVLPRYAAYDYSEVCGECWSVLNGLNGLVWKPTQPVIDVEDAGGEPPPNTPTIGTNFPFELPLVVESWGLENQDYTAAALATRLTEAGFASVAVQLDATPRSGRTHADYIADLTNDVVTLKAAGLQVIGWNALMAATDAADLVTIGAEGWMPQVEGPSQLDAVIASLGAGTGAGLPKAVITNYGGLDTAADVAALAAAGIDAAAAEVYAADGHSDVIAILAAGASYGFDLQKVVPILGTYAGETGNDYAGFDDGVIPNYGIYHAPQTSEEAWDYFGMINGGSVVPGRATFVLGSRLSGGTCFQGYITETSVSAMPIVVSGAPIPTPMRARCLTPATSSRKTATLEGWVVPNRPSSRPLTVFFHVVIGSSDVVFNKGTVSGYDPVYFTHTYTTFALPGQVGRYRIYVESADTSYYNTIKCQWLGLWQPFTVLPCVVPPTNVIAAPITEVLTNVPAWQT